MNIINKLTLRHLQKNKRRTFVTIIGVILSVTMLGAVSVGANSFLDVLRRRTISDTGEWHVRYEDVSLKQMERIRSDFYTKELMLTENIGFSKLEGSQNAYKPYLFLRYFNQSALEKLAPKLTEGRMPQTENEVVVFEHVRTNGGVQINVGDTLHLELGKRVTDAKYSFKIQKRPEKEPGAEETGVSTDSKLIGDEGLDNKILFGLEEDGTITETLQPIGKKEVKVVGICKRSSLEARTAPGYTIISRMNEDKLNGYSKLSAWVISRNVSNKLYQNAEQLRKEIGIDTSCVAYNNSLLRYYGVTENPFLRSMLIAVIGVVTVIIIIGSVSLIYNAFSISVSERARYLGMMASVGATKHQKKKSVLFEGLLIGLVSIPFGFLFAMIGMAVTFQLISPLFQEVYEIEEPLRLVVSWGSVVLTVMLTAVTILISTWKPARQAARISPIDAIRQNQDIKIKANQVKTAKLTRRLFGFEGNIALKNLKRNKKRYRTTVISIILSVVLFISVSGAMLYAQKSIDIQMETDDFDICVSADFEWNDEKSREKARQLFERIRTEDDVDKSTASVNFSLSADLPGNLLTNKLYTILKEQENADGKIPYTVSVYAMADKELNKLANRAGISLEKLKDKEKLRAIAVNKIERRDLEGKWFSDRIIANGKGEQILVAGLEPDAKPFGKIEIAGSLEEMPLGTRSTGGDMQILTLIVSEEQLPGILSKARREHVNYNLMLRSKSPDELEKRINSLITEKNSFYMYNAASSRRESNQQKILYSVFLYGFVCLISMICIANIFNTISTGVALRKREFAMLRSVGMTTKQFNRMIRFESLFYGLKGLLYGLPLSIGVCYLIYTMFHLGIEFGFALPWKAIAGSVLTVFVVVGITMIYATRKLKQDNIIEILRQENI